MSVLSSLRVTIGPEDDASWRALKDVPHGWCVMSRTGVDIGGGTRIETGCPHVVYKANTSKRLLSEVIAVVQSGASVYCTDHATWYRHGNPVEGHVIWFQGEVNGHQLLIGVEATGCLPREGILQLLNQQLNTPLTAKPYPSCPMEMDTLRDLSGLHIAWMT